MQFYSSYVTSKFNLKNSIQLMSENDLKNTWESYEEIIYQNLLNKIRQFIFELSDENWLPERPNDSPHNYVEGMVAYLSVMYDSLCSLSPNYIENCFRPVIEYIPKIFLGEVLLNTKNMKNYNFYFIENLKWDVETLDDFFNKMNLVKQTNNYSFNNNNYNLQGSSINISSNSYLFPLVKLFMMFCRIYFKSY